MLKTSDLSDYSTQTKDTIQKKFSSFIKNEELHNEQNLPDKHKNQAEAGISEAPNEGEEKIHRVNMAFSDSNYEFISSETYKLGVNFMRFLNHIISSTSVEEINSFMDHHPWLKGGRSAAPRRRGYHMKRINFKIYKENHEKLKICASNNNATITTIVNAILETYITKI